MSEQTKPEFGKLRSIFWPVHGFELKKLLPMYLLMFLISFNYTILRDTKDTLIVTAEGSGAEAIPFLKVWGVVPLAIFFMLLYSKMSNILSKPRLFYATIAPFIIFFGLFATVIYPNRELLHPTTSADLMQSLLPEGLSGLVACYRNWTYSLFYIMAEMWGSVALSLLFWGFANDITKVSEAKRFYSQFGLAANLALPISGFLIVYFSDIRSLLPADVDAWGMTLNYLMSLVALAGVSVMAIYWWINKYVLTDPRYYNPEEIKKPKKEKLKMSIGESLAFLAKSKYILCLTMLVIGYGISINLVEVTWKNQLKLQYPNANEYSAFMGWFSQMTGYVSIVMMIIASSIIRRFGWGTSAMITPVVLLVTGVGFFSFVIFRDNLSGFIAQIGTTPLFLAVIFGMAQNIMSKSTKYSLFDPTKEMAYIPLDPESKVKGKAAIDVVGARFGKSGGALIQQGLLVAFGTIGAITPYVAGILFVIIGGWIVSVRSLNKQFTALTEKPKDKAMPISTKAETAAS